MQSIPVQEAVKSAKKSLLELYADDPPKALALEEIEFVNDDGRAFWSVTLGFHRSKHKLADQVAKPSIPSYLKPPPESEIENRIYKTVFIDANTGDFVKMDMRQVQ